MNTSNILLSAAGVADSVLSDASGGSPALSLSLSALSYAGNPGVSEFSSILDGLSASLGFTDSANFVDNIAGTIERSLSPANNVDAGTDSGGLSAVNPDNSQSGGGVDGNLGNSMNYGMLYVSAGAGGIGALYPGVVSPAQAQQLSVSSASDGSGNTVLSVAESSAQQYNQSVSPLSLSSAPVSNNDGEKKSLQNNGSAQPNLPNQNVLNAAQNGNLQVDMPAAANADFNVNGAGNSGSAGGAKNKRQTEDSAKDSGTIHGNNTSAGAGNAVSDSSSAAAKKNAGANNNGLGNNNSNANADTSNKFANDTAKMSDVGANFGNAAASTASLNNNISINNYNKNSHIAKGKNITDTGTDLDNAGNGKTDGRTAKNVLSSYDLSALNNENGKPAADNLTGGGDNTSELAGNAGRVGNVINGSIDNTVKNSGNKNSAASALHENMNNINNNINNINLSAADSKDSNSNSNQAASNKNVKDAYAAFEKVIGNGKNGANSSNRRQQQSAQFRHNSNSKELSILAADYLKSGASEEDNLTPAGNKSGKLTFSDAGDAELNNTLHGGLIQTLGSLNSAGAAGSGNGTAGSGSNFSNELAASLNNDINNAAGGNSSPASLTASTLSVMLKKNMQSAVITLKPASLGSIKINLSITGADGSGLNGLNKLIAVNILTQTDEAKNMLQSSSLNLTDALKNQGFTSINLNISSGFNNGGGDGDQSFADNYPANSGKNYASSLNRGYANANGGSLSGAGGAINSGGALPLMRGNSVIDYFV